ncbi:GH17106 [Drosophila grimshawi]|uniref:GH17106 n=1 Tax=Drosophila grimshawi TaxID=7222 RepID=B4J074_DROGR|nr:GH17106 [Drosophila grimshawi]
MPTSTNAKSKKGVDPNNNENDSLKKTSKLKFELPANYKYEVQECICFRPKAAFECRRCNHYICGRICEVCQQHPMVTFLMDFNCCPCCSAPTTDIKLSQLSLEEIHKIEDGILPDDNDDFN